jgi:hypothetical protein
MVPSLFPELPASFDTPDAIAVQSDVPGYSTAKCRGFYSGTGGRRHVSDGYRLEPGLIARFVAIDDGLDKSDAL